MDHPDFCIVPILGSNVNFCLSEQDKSDDAADPGLHTGLAYCVEHEEYLTHVQKYASQTDISSCSGFRTLVHMESKNNKGLRVTGVHICVCMCHKMILPLAAGNLQIGERCKERMKVMPQKVRIREDMVLDFGVPKLHCKAHNWAWHKWTSTKEMGPDVWHDTINDQMGGHNWQKITHIGDLLHERQERAVLQCTRQATIHTVFTEALLTNKRWAQDWTEHVKAREKNDTVANLYFQEAKHEY
ncbi:hypothetical protein EDD85DRAFT_791120 [Armillaria nabsnona]|nr:hypothetical protein EDD85DRAFT_791120 [Armillaria nabsnona]